MPPLSAPAKKVILIFFLTILAAIISMPKQIRLNLHLGSFRIERITRPDINVKIGKVEIKRNFDLKLGLDLAGGSHLVFEADFGGIPADKKKDALDSVRNVIEKRVNLFGVSEPVVQTSSFAGKDRIIVELPGVKDAQSASDIIGKVAQLNFAEVEEASPSSVFIPTDLSGADLENARVAFDSKTGKPSVSLQFTKEGGEKFAQITEKNIGKPLAIILDGELVSAPTVQEKIVGGQAQITGSFTVDEAKNLVIQLNAGALPVPVKLIEERTVGATLGGESISRSIIAGLVGLVMVLIFMILAYGWLGLIADLGLIVFSLLTLALYKLIPITLTLPGIAGFLLSVGMAVDSNILIFERFKEERRRRSIPDALEVSFGRAWDSIRDANIATLFTAFILANPLDLSFLNTSGPVRGFAFTLALGILISLFTGVVVSRNLLRLLVKEKKK
jgi:preprotein translocase subunit SecD